MTSSYLFSNFDSFPAQCEKNIWDINLKILKLEPQASSLLYVHVVPYLFQVRFPLTTPFILVWQTAIMTLPFIVYSCHPECTFSDDIDHRRRLIEGLLLNALLRELDSASDSPARYSLHFGDRSTFSMNCCLHRDRSPESNRCSWRPNRPSPQGSFHSQGVHLVSKAYSLLQILFHVCYFAPIHI